jgi:Fe-S cluster assembly protein SufD
LPGLRQSDDFIGLLNGIYVSGGAYLDVSDGASLSVPVEIQNRHAGGQHHTRLAVTIGAGAKGTFIERHVSSSDDQSLVTSITDIEVGERADATWIICQEQGGSDTHLAQTNIKLGADARLTFFVINMGGELVRQEVHTDAAGERSDFAFRAINLLGDASHTDITLTLNHLVPNCVSTETVRNVVFDRARGVFQGQINVDRIAQKTDARMACNTLLLSDTAEFDTKPELEIFADDVQCAHGATVTDIEDSHLFYLRSRGITEKRARSMLVNAFIAEIVEELENDELVEALESRFSDWLERHA